MYVMIMCPLTLSMTLDCSLELVMVSLYVFVPRCYGIMYGCVAVFLGVLSSTQTLC